MTALAELKGQPLPANLTPRLGQPTGLKEAEAVRTDIGGSVLAGLATLALLIGGFFAWAALTPLASAVHGSGVVVVESNRRDVQHLEGGIVRRILVREGASVQAGDPLILLDPTRPAAALHITRGQLDAVQTLLGRLRAELSGSDDLVLDEETATRAETDPDLRDLIQGQRQILQARRAAVNGQIDVLRQRIAQIETQINGQEAQERARLRQIELLQMELDAVNELLRSGFAPRTRALALSREIARLRGEQGEYLAAVARLRQQIGEAQLQILQIERAYQEEVTRQMQEAQNQARELAERLAVAQDVVRNLEIRAPVSGTVVGLTVFTEGGVIQPGRTLMQIVPEGDGLVIEAQIASQDIEAVKLGMPVQIRFPALPQRTLPMLTGTVKHVSADRLVDERTGFGYYKVRAVLDPESQALVADRRLVPGMPAEVTIPTGERTVLRYLADPILDAVRKSLTER